MSTTDLNDLIERAYEAAVVPENWPNVLQSIAEIADARGAILLTADAKDLRWAASLGVLEDMRAFDEGGWHARNSRLPRLLKAQPAGFLREIDVFTPDEIETDYHITQFFRPRGLGWGAGMAVPVPTGDFLVYSIERDYPRGPIEQEAIVKLDSLRGALSRSAMLAARLGLQQARAMTRTLEAIGLPAAVLRGSGRLYAGNALFDKLVPSVFEDRRERIACADAEADLLFAKSLPHLVNVRLKMPPCSIALRATAQHGSMVAHLLPICGAAHDIFFQATGLIIITPIDRRIVPDAKVISALFDLTPAEARVASSIGDGNSVDGAAVKLGVSRETVRSQLKSVLQKTGRHRQQDLIKLLLGTTIHSSSDDSR